MPLAGLTVSQLASSDTLQASVPPPAFEIESVRAAGFDPAAGSEAVVRFRTPSFGQILGVRHPALLFINSSRTISMDRGLDHPDPGPSNADLTLLLERVGQGDREAMDHLFRAVYDELHSLARAQRSRWSGNQTLNTTAILHESYLKLIRADRVHARDRSHFFTLASRAMRQILVNYARDRHALKRGGGDGEHVSHENQAFAGMPALAAEQLIELDDALRDLERHSERSARVVECRFFAGLSVDETAEALNTSPATVKRDWALASRWLRVRLGPEDGRARTDPPGPDSV